ncbi:tetratricopeptide repeat protein [Candidatus Mycalebacterium sp.]
MNNNDIPPDSPPSTEDGRLSNAAGVLEKISDRVLSMSWLSIATVVFVAVTALLFYAFVVDSREKEVVKASVKMDAAVAAYENGEVDSSLELLRGIRNDFPNFEIAELSLYYEGAILFGMEKDEKSRERMDDFLAGSPDPILKTEALFMAGFSSFRLEEWKKAIGYFEKLIPLGTPSHARRVLPLLGTAYTKTGNREKAEEIYRIFVITFPVPGPQTEQP